LLDPVEHTRFKDGRPEWSPEKDGRLSIMPMHRFTCAMAALVVATSAPAPVTAQGTTKEVKISGMGVRKCAEWQQWKEERNGEARAMALEWTQGFISGHNVYAGSGTGNSVVADVKVLLPLIDSFCERNPDSRILNVVIQITRSLGGANVRADPKPPAPTLNPNPPQRVPPAGDTPNSL